jgi:hypothetical protein
MEKKRKRKGKEKNNLTNEIVSSSIICFKFGFSNVPNGSENARNVDPANNINFFSPPPPFLFRSYHFEVLRYELRKEEEYMRGLPLHYSKFWLTILLLLSLNSSEVLFERWALLRSNESLYYFVRWEGRMAGEEERQRSGGRGRAREGECTLLNAANPKRL